MQHIGNAMKVYMKVIPSLTDFSISQFEKENKTSQELHITRLVTTTVELQHF